MLRSYSTQYIPIKHTLLPVMWLYINRHHSLSLWDTPIKCSFNRWLGLHVLWWLLRTGEMAYCVKLLAQVESLLYLSVVFRVLLSVGSGDSWCHVSYYMQLKSHVIFPQGLISLGYTLDFPILLHYPPTVPRSLSEKTLKLDLGSLQVLSARGPSWGHAPWQQHREYFSCLVLSGLGHGLLHELSAVSSVQQLVVAQGLSQKSSFGSLNRRTHRLTVTQNMHSPESHNA